MNRFADWIRACTEFFLDLLFPRDIVCLACEAALPPEAKDGLCPACAEALEALEAQQTARHTDPAPGVAYVLAAYPYTAQARRLVIRLKYHHIRDAAVPLARALATLPGEEADLLVPIPTTKRRKRERGYNQAEVLCRLIAEETGMPMAEALARGDERAEQAGLSGRSRRQNLKGTMTADARVRGKRVLLIDDVYTTGSTAEEAARALHAAGAIRVGMFAAAKSMYDGDSSAGQQEA